MSGKLPTLPSTTGASGGSKTFSSRRRAMNSSEESQSVPLVTIDTTDFYRSGAPNPLPALPLKSELVAPNSQVWTRYKSIQSSIISALKGAGIGPFNMTLTHRFVRGESPTINDVTILITMRRDQQRDNLTVAVNEVLDLLFRAQVHNIRVEAMDPRANRRFFVPTVSTTFLTAMWGVLKREITAILGRTNYSWCSFTVLNRGHQESQSETVIVIGVRRSASFEWKAHVRFQVLDLLEKARLNMDVVFVRESFLSAGVAEPIPRPLTEFSGPVIIGSSTAMEDIYKNSGTLGGYFTLENQNGQKKVFGVTNHHVVFSDDTIEEAKKAGKSEMEFLGVKKQGESSWEVQSPSLADRDALLSIHDLSIEEHGKGIDGYDTKVPGTQRQEHYEGLRVKLQRATWSGSDTTKVETELQFLEDSREACIRDKDELQNKTELKFATVFATSGRGQFGKRDGDGNRKAMDWALLECLQSRLGDNTMPMSEKFQVFYRGASQPQSTKGKGVERGKPFGGKLVQQATRFSNRDQYFAYTRSGHKVGRFSQCDVVGHMEDDPETYTAMVFVNSDEDFMRLGDSGCWILNILGQLEALGFAASPENLTGYAIPIQDVYEDIQKRLGAKIVDPEWKD